MQWKQCYKVYSVDTLKYDLLGKVEKKKPVLVHWHWKTHTVPKVLFQLLLINIYNTFPLIFMAPYSHGFFSPTFSSSPCYASPSSSWPLGVGVPRAWSRALFFLDTFFWALLVFSMACMPLKCQCLIGLYLQFKLLCSRCIEPAASRKPYLGWLPQTFSSSRNPPINKWY